jgi:hypothetical protein
MEVEVPTNGAGKRPRATKPKEKERPIEIAQIEIVTIAVELEGLSPYIAHNWSDRSRQQLVDSQTKEKEAGKQRDKRNPEQEFEGAKYKDRKGRDCAPARGFHKALQEAATIQYKASKSMTMTKTFISGSIFVLGDFIPIEFEKCEMREDIIAGKGTRGAMPCWRPMYHKWRCKLEVQFNSKLLTIEQVVGIINFAGFSVGIGSQRPGKGGGYGRWRLADRPIKRS